jgi:hypothetical protein
MSSGKSAENSGNGNGIPSYNIKEKNSKKVLAAQSGTEYEIPMNKT